MNDKSIDKSGEVKETAKKPKKLNAQGTKNAADYKKPLLISAIALAVIVVVVLSVVLIANNSPIAKILTNLSKNPNYHMTATISGIPLVGSLSLEQKVDGNITYTSKFLLTPEQYKEIVDNETYVYTKNSSGVWVKEKSENSGNAINEMFEELVGDLNELTNPKNYKKVKGEENKYKQKDNVSFDGCKDVVITIEDDEITVELTIDFEGAQLPSKLVISEIGKVELTLPEV